MVFVIIVLSPAKSVPEDPIIHYYNEHKKAKGVNKNVVATISHNEYKDVLLNNKCVRHSMNRIQSRDHRIGTYEINKILFQTMDMAD